MLGGEGGGVLVCCCLHVCLFVCLLFSFQGVEGEEPVLEHSATEAGGCHLHTDRSVTLRA